jgi:hypothetical protein
LGQREKQKNMLKSSVEIYACILVDRRILYSYIVMEKTNLEKEIYLGVHYDDDNQGKQELEDDREDGVAETE